jgi:hypothetical protein
MLFGSSLLPGLARGSDCFQEAQAGARPGVWDAILTYFKTLTPGSQGTESKARLTRLRAEIVRYESEKQRIIEIIEAHIQGAESGSTSSRNLQASEIPNALSRLDDIAKHLTELAEEGNLFRGSRIFQAATD